MPATEQACVICVMEQELFIHHLTEKSNTMNTVKKEVSPKNADTATKQANACIAMVQAIEDCIKST